MRTPGAAPPGSESMACLGGIIVNVGDPHSPPWMEYGPTSSKRQGSPNDYEEVSEGIIPEMRVTTAEGSPSGDFNLGRETYMEETKSTNSTATKLKRVAQLSGEDPRMEFIGLMPHVNKESLIGCFNELDGRKAVGIDRMTKEEYGKDLERNIEDLISRMKGMSYFPLSSQRSHDSQGQRQVQAIGDKQSRGQNSTAYVQQNTRGHI